MMCSSGVHLPTHVYITSHRHKYLLHHQTYYGIVQLCGRGKYWRIWQIGCYLPCQYFLTLSVLTIESNFAKHQSLQITIIKKVCVCVCVCVRACALTLVHACACACMYCKCIPTYLSIPIYGFEQLNSQL